MVSEERRRSTQINDVEDPASTAPSVSQPSPLEQEYTQVNENFRRLADIRFRLLAFVPALGGVAVYVLATAGLSAENTPRQPTNADLWLVALIAATGFFVTLGITFYDQRNSELYNALIHRAKYLESKFKLPRSPKMPTEGISGGQFNERPGRDRRLFGLKLFEMGHDTALALVYGPVLGAWFFPLLLSALNLAGASSRTSFGLACVAGVIAGGAFTVELIRQDKADDKRWRRAGVIECLASDIRDRLSQYPPGNEDNLNEKVGAILRGQRERSKIKFKVVRGVPDRSLKGKDLLIESKYIHSPDSLDEAVKGIAENIQNKKYRKRCHILLLAYDPHQAIADDEEYKASIKLKGRCTVRIVRSRQQAGDP
jgi:hypothetical protein